MGLVGLGIDPIYGDALNGIPAAGPPDHQAEYFDGLEAPITVTQPRAQWQRLIAVADKAHDLALHEATSYGHERYERSLAPIREALKESKCDGGGDGGGWRGDEPMNPWDQV